MNNNKSIVFAGSFWTGSTESGLSQGFRTLGWCVQEIDGRDIGAIGQQMTTLRVASRLTRRTSQSIYRKQLIRACTVLRPKYFVTVKGSAITKDLLQRIKGTGAQTVMYYPDFHFNHPDVSVDSFDEYDFFITTKTHQLEHLRERLPSTSTVAYIPHGYCSAVHRPVHASVAESDFQVDVQHAGNHSAYKQEWIEGARRALPETTFRVIGSHWWPNVKPGPLDRREIAEARTGIAYAEAIQSARINVAVLMGPTRHGWEDRVSTRTFEIPACGGFMLHIDNEEVRDLYKVGSEIDVFATPDELADKIGYYLRNPGIRQRMVQRAYGRCVTDYSYDMRAKQIMELIDMRT